MLHDLKILSLFLISIVNFHLGLSQQDPLFTHFWHSNQAFNPAVTGLNHQHEANLLARWAWNGVNGAPDTQLGTYGAKVDKWKSGFGINYMRGSIGFSKENKAVGTYAYHLKFKNESTLSFGMAAGIQHLFIDFSQLIFPNGETSDLPPYNKTVFIADFGAHFKKEKWTIGLSSTSLNQPKTTYYQVARHYYFTTAYDLELSDKWLLQPKFFAVSDAVKLSAQIHVLTSYKKFLTFGAGYRISDAICVNASYRFKEKFRLGYAYDITVNKLSNISRGSHEFVFSFSI